MKDGMDFIEMLKKMAETGIMKIESTTRVQAAQIKPAHMLKHRTYVKERETLQRKAHLLIGKLKLLHAQEEQTRLEHWEWIYDVCEIPSDQQYVVDKKGCVKKIVGGDES